MAHAPFLAADRATRRTEVAFCVRVHFTYDDKYESWHVDADSGFHIERCP